MVVGGGALAAELLRYDALHNYAIYGISVFAGCDRTVDELAQQPLHRRWVSARWR